MRILITGGAGFIGAHISKILLDEGHRVAIYDNLSNSSKEFIDDRSLFIQGDLSNFKLLEDSLRQVDLVIHLAGMALVEESIRYPLEYVENNITGSVILLNAMDKMNVKRIIFSSSCTVYGLVKPLPITENSPILAVNPYGATKVAVENLLHSYHLNQGFDVTILRYFNPFGPFETHKPETHVIPNFIKLALKKEPIPLYWQGEGIRDFIYVEDLAMAHNLVLNLKGWNIFNIGTEKGIKVKEIIKALEEILGYKIKISDFGERKGDVPAIYSSSQKLIKTTGWKPRFSLNEGIKKTVDWFKDYYIDSSSNNSLTDSDLFSNFKDILS